MCCEVTAELRGKGPGRARGVRARGGARELFRQQLRTTAAESLYTGAAAKSLFTLCTVVRQRRRLGCKGAAGV